MTPGTANGRRFPSLVALSSALTLVMIVALVADLRPPPATHLAVDAGDGTASSILTFSEEEAEAGDAPQVSSEVGPSEGAAEPDASDTAPGPGDAATEGTTTRTTDSGGSRPAASRTGPWYETGVLRVGTIVSQSGPADLSMAEQAVRAYFQSVNESGGVHGLKLELIAYDDGFDASTGLLRARRLVEQDDVFAVVGWLAPQTEPEALGFFEQQGVPVFGGTGYPEQATSPVSFLASINKGRGMAGVAPIICRYDPGKVQAVVVDAAFADQAIDSIVTQFERGCPGAEILGVDKVSAATPDYTPHVLRWRNRGADTVLAMLDVGSYNRLFLALGRQGWKPQVFTFGYADLSANQQVAQYLEGTVDIGAQIVPWIHDQHPGAQRYLATVRRYYPTTKVGNYSQLAYAAAQVFVEGLRRAGPDFTRESLIETVASGEEFHPDTTGPIRYSPGDHDGVRCAEVVRWQGSDWVEQYDAWQCWEYHDQAARAVAPVPMYE
jgi:branched-chain amino acid transport system substrate-binding protein